MAMNAANIPLGHLYSTGIQPNHVVSPDELELVDKLTNPNYLADKQAAEVGRLMADVRLPEIEYDLKGKAVSRLDQYQKASEDLLRNQKGDRTKFNNASKLQLLKLRHDLNLDLSAMNQHLKDFNKTQGDVARYASQGVLDKDTEIATFNEYKKKLKDPLIGFGELPIYSNMIAEVVKPKLGQKQKENEDKLRKEALAVYEPMVKDLSRQNFGPITQAQARKWVDDNYKDGSKGWDIIRNKMIFNGTISEITPDNEARDIYAEIGAKKAHKLNITSGWGAQGSQGLTYNVDENGNKVYNIESIGIQHSGKVKLEDGTEITVVNSDVIKLIERPDGTKYRETTVQIANPALEDPSIPPSIKKALPETIKVIATAEGEGSAEISLGSKKIKALNKASDENTKQAPKPKLVF